MTWVCQCPSHFHIPCTMKKVPMVGFELTLLMCTCGGVRNRILSFVFKGQQRPKHPEKGLSYT